MGPTVKPPVLSPAPLAGRGRETAATFSAGRRRLGLRQKRLARNVEVILLPSIMSEFTTSCRTANLKDGLEALM